MTSNESSASETTPLRRPDSRTSEDVPNIVVAPASPPTAANTSQRAVHQRSAPLPSTVVANNRNNNNNIEIHLAHTIAGNSYQNNNNHINKPTMDTTNKRILLRVGLDLFLLICVGLPILGFFSWGEPYQRGFFCDDESLMHPFHDSTVRNWMLYIIGLVLPIGTILIVELVRFYHHEKTGTGNATQRRYVFQGYEFPDWMVECYKKIGIFGFGAAVCQLVTDVAKYTIGRLRPHFFAVCQPVMPDGTTCADPINAGRYIENFSCVGLNSSARMLKEMRLSFPSGHSSFTFFTMVYLALYLQSRMKWRGSKLLRHFLQFAFILIAWYTALSRVSDYKHHWSDVLAGTVIGSLSAVVVAKYVSDLFQPNQFTKAYILPRSTQDMTTISTGTTTTN